MPPGSLVDWRIALTLRERAAFIRLDGPDSTIQTVSAQERLARWCYERGLDEDALARRLRADGIGADDFKLILGGQLPAVPRAPHWVRRTARAYQAAQPPSLLVWDPCDAAICFTPVIGPLVTRITSHVYRRASRVLKSHPGLPFTTEALGEALLPNVQRYLNAIVTPTLVRSLWDSKVTNELHGESSEERFVDFVRRLTPPARLDLFERYPVLARILSEAADRWIVFLTEFIDRLAADWILIKHQILDGAEPGSITTVKVTGDFHQNGRAVLRLDFTSGKRLIYKPRSVTISRHFQTLLSWCNSRFHPSYRTFVVVDRGQYGWCEFIEHAPCTTSEAVSRFYERHGGYVALLHALAGTDFHRENVVACGEYPILVDVETLFQGTPRATPTRDADRLARRALAESVLRTGLLPKHFGAGGDDAGLQLGGIGNDSTNKPGRRVLRWADVGTDQMHAIRQHVSLPSASNAPTIGNSAVDFMEHEQDVITGFRRMYQLLTDNRNELRATEGPLSPFWRDRTRILVRNSDFYGTVLRESYHPSLMHDALDRDCVFDHLWRATATRSELARTFSAECTDLWSEDIPLFEADIDSKELRTSSGVSLGEFFSESGMARARRNLEQLNSTDLALQTFVVSASFASSVTTANHTEHSVGTDSPTSVVVQRVDLLDTATVLARILEGLARPEGDDGLNWLGLLSASTGRWEVAPIGYDVYNGLSGLILFFAQLGRLSEEQSFTILAHRALQTLRAHMSTSEITSVGFYHGISGVVYVYAHLAAIWRDDTLLAEAAVLASRVNDMLNAAQPLDIIYGLAGCIGGLLSLYSVSKSPTVRDTLLRCGSRLVAEWHPSTSPLSGFSHGASGIAWALVQLWGITNDGRFLASARHALQYERTLFSATEFKWRDLRHPDEDTLRYGIGWCNGSPGIGLSRIGIARYLPSTDVLNDIRFAMRSITTTPLKDQSMCHGQAAALELALTATEHGFDDGAKEYLHNNTAEFNRRAVSRSGICGVPNGTMTPGLMLGFAGVGYQLLRLGFPGQIPSVLLMDSPSVESYHGCTRAPTDDT